MSLMTKEEASKKWCPFSRAFSAFASGGYNRVDGTGTPASCCCIHNKCMAWREPSNDGKGICALITFRG
jgi:hypothetical protein